MKALVFAWVVLAGWSAVNADDSANWTILLGDDKSVRFEPPASNVIYTATGIKATPAAREYSEEVRQMVTEGATVLPLKFGNPTMRMVGLLTWQETHEPQLVLARVGDLIDVRRAIAADGFRQFRYMFNPFGLLAVVTFGLLIASNCLLWRDSFGAGGVVAFISFIAFVATIICFSPINEFRDNKETAVLTAFLCMGVLLSVFSAFVAAREDTKMYGVMSGALVLLLGIAVWVVV